MDSLDTSTLLLLAPVLLVDLTLKIIALTQLHRAERVRFDSKLLWAAIILLVSPFGWIGWFVLGREDM